ncbi:UNVERIFIED_ORG: lipoprotein NlpD [Burkholderia sp. CF145]|uniref:peptidoglycan DD-metalloendopeptidase family protein n=1 Tax=Paraburkholderia hospita TaxID=169430 RepID=UPI0002718ACA|nr:peptidoglycan DD-metalloendopeptidase family protein [Paraburkholderia hospita]EUC19411.1 Peptidase M23 [Burkholderia sp. BT03]SKC69295.1 Murein DD-endopeptidase MepM and murein hydrolase activator NlpD, contain LysM domain [Paraburkholderia hospita]
MSKNGFDRTWASFASFTLALMLGACAHVGEQDANKNDAASAAQTAADPAPAALAPQMVAQPVPPVVYKVRRGDSLARIARSHNVTVKQVLAWNHLKPSSRLHIGQALKVSSPDAVKMVAAPSAPAQAATPSSNANGAAAASSGTSGASSSTASGAASNTTGTSNATASAPATGAPAPSAADAREVNAELARHAKGVSLIWPAQGNVVEGFQAGETRGIEIGGKPGDPIRAAADGKVMYAGTGLNEYGSLIIVQHNKDFLTAYAHNRKLLVKTGDIVRRGQQIAEMGSENNSRVSVLFELRRDGKPIDPMPFLPHQRG